MWSLQTLDCITNSEAKIAGNCTNSNRLTTVMAILKGIICSTPVFGLTEWWNISLYSILCQVAAKKSPKIRVCENTQTLCSSTYTEIPKPTNLVFGHHFQTQPKPIQNSGHRIDRWENPKNKKGADQSYWQFSFLPVMLPIVRTSNCSKPARLLCNSHWNEQFDPRFITQWLKSSTNKTDENWVTYLHIVPH